MQPQQHPPDVTHLLWTAMKEDAQKLNTELVEILPQDGLSLPILTCSAHPARCLDFPSPDAPCMRAARRALCVAVGKACQALVVTVEEPTRCCCGLEGRNTTLIGKITNITLRKTCPPSSEGTAGQVERTEGQGVEELILSSEGSAMMPDAEDFEPFNTTTRVRMSEREDGVEEITEEHVKKTSVLEDTIAALVFLFVGVVLVIIKSRLFRFTKKKLVNEDKEDESEETLVDETII